MIYRECIVWIQFDFNFISVTVSLLLVSFKWYHLNGFGLGNEG